MRDALINKRAVEKSLGTGLGFDRPNREEAENGAVYADRSVGGKTALQEILRTQHHLASSQVSLRSVTLRTVRHFILDPRRPGEI